MLGDSFESLASYTEGNGPQPYDRPVSLWLLVEVVGRLGCDFPVTAAASHRFEASPIAPHGRSLSRPATSGQESGVRVLSLHVDDRLRRNLRNGARHCKAQAATLTVEAGVAAERGDAWSVER
jgi:hypothetical protein